MSLLAHGEASAYSAFQSCAPQREHDVGKRSQGFLVNSRAQRRQRKTSGVILLNANIPKNTATHAGITMMTRMSKSSGMPGESIDNGSLSWS